MLDRVLPLFSASLLATALALSPDAAAQRFRGPVVIKSGSKCLSVHPALVRTNGAKVSLFECRGGPNQQWTLERGRVVHVASNRCLDVNGPDVNFNGARIQLWDCNGAPNQAWRYDGQRLLEQADNRCLDIHGPDMEQNGAHVQTWDCNGGPNQAFQLEPVGYAPPPPPPVVIPPPPPPPAPIVQDREAGPLWSNNDANRRCPQVCAPLTWNGQWRTTVPGRMSVCACTNGGVQVVPPPPPAPVVAPPVGPMDNGRFGAMLQAVRGESFSQGKLRVIETAGANEYFLVGQVRQTLDQLSFSHDKLRALQMMAPRILDRNNNFMLYSAFTFEADKAKARAILGQ